MVHLDPELLLLDDELGYSGYNDPLDVMEVGSQPLPMGSIVPYFVYSVHYH